MCLADSVLDTRLPVVPTHRIAYKRDDTRNSHTPIAIHTDTTSSLITMSSDKRTDAVYMAKVRRPTLYISPHMPYRKS